MSFARKLTITVASALTLCAASALAAGTADTVFTGGKVYTVNEKQPWAEAVAVKGNKIVYVGDAVGAKSFIGDGTDVIDASGKTILPGFVSGHDHLVGAGWLLAGVKLTDAKDQDELLKRIKEYADANPDLKYILGNGWNFEQFKGRPTAAMLDAIVPDRPVILTDYTCHEAWLNSAALKLGNVTKDTPDVLSGTTYWERDKDGNPTGVGLEFQWLPTYIQSGAWQPEIGFPDSIDMMMGTAMKNGTTTVQVTGIVSPMFTNWEGQKKDFAIAMEILNDMKEQGTLPMRVLPMPIYKDMKATVEDFVGYAANMNKKYNDDMLRVQSIKIHPEGNWTAHAAPFLEPYLDTGKKGDFGVPPERSKALTLAANKAGLNTIIHTDGDASARAAIDAFEAANKAGYKDLRNAIHHLIWVHPDDYKRIVEMDIPINSTPGFGNDFGGQAEQAIAWMGEERVKAEFARYPDLARDGVKVSISADVLSTPLSSQAPLFVVEAAVTMMEPSNQGNSKPFPPGRKGMSVEQAIRAVTIDPAWQLKMEDKIGSLEVGKYADLVVLEANPLEVDPLQIEEIDVLMTMVDGKIKYRIDQAPEDTYPQNQPRVTTGAYR
jgi:predicted amidohydrolase YtcJ